VLAGASQGAGLAASATLNGEASADGWLAVVGAPQPRVARMARLVPGALVVGGDDPLAAANQRVFHEAVLAAGGRCAWQEVPGLSHDYPADWADRAPGLLRSLLG
jgi:predicted esterase